MAPVFGHGRLRLYLLSLLAEAPRHGYEVIRLLEERFQGLYAPSAGTVYPRLTKLEQEGLVTHTADGGRKVYAITEAGRAELADRQDELAELESDIRESVAELAADIREDVHGSAERLREEMRQAARRAGTPSGGGPSADGGTRNRGTPRPPWEEPGFPGDREAWKQAKQEWQRAKQEAKTQARRAKEESRRAKEEARRAREQSQWVKRQAQDEVRRIKEQLQESVQRGDWPTGLAESFAELGRVLGRTAPPKPDAEGPHGGRAAGSATAPGSATDRPGPAADADADTTRGADVRGGPADLSKQDPSGGLPDGELPDGELPDWARTRPGAEPLRELERLLDRFRDQLRDAARDGGVTAAQLDRAARLLARTARDWRG